MKFVTQLVLLSIAVLLVACNKPKENIEPTPSGKNKEEQKQSIARIKADLTQRGFEIFDYIDQETGDTVIMQKYFIAFLKSGPNRDQPKAVADSLQALHMAHLGNMYKQGFADISGPFDEDGVIRGITIYNVPTKQMADSLANADPMVKAGRLQIEIHSWWAAKGFSLR